MWYFIIAGIIIILFNIFWMVWTGMSGNQEKIIEGMEPPCAHNQRSPNYYNDYITTLQNEINTQTGYRNNTEKKKKTLENNWGYVRPKIQDRYKARMRTIYSSSMEFIEYIIKRNDINKAIYKDLIEGYTMIKEGTKNTDYFTAQIQKLTHTYLANEQDILNINKGELNAKILSKERLNNIYNDIKNKIPGGDIISKAKFIADFAQESHNYIHDLAKKNKEIYSKAIKDYAEWNGTVVLAKAVASVQAVKVEYTCTYEVEIKLANEIYDIIIDKSNIMLENKKNKIINLVNQLENRPCYENITKPQFKELRRIIEGVSELRFMLELLKHWYVRFYVSGCDNQIKQYTDLNFQNSNEYSFEGHGYPNNQKLIKILNNQDINSCKKLGEIQKILPDMISTQQARPLVLSSSQSSSPRIQSYSSRSRSSRPRSRSSSPRSRSSSPRKIASKSSPIRRR